MYMNPMSDPDILRQHRNLTTTQQKKNLSTREGVAVNNFVKENENNSDLNLSETKDSFVLSGYLSIPVRLLLWRTEPVRFLHD